MPAGISLEHITADSEMQLPVTGDHPARIPRSSECGQESLNPPAKIVVIQTYFLGTRCNPGGLLTFVEKSIDRAKAWAFPRIISASAAASSLLHLLPAASRAPSLMRSTMCPCLDHTNEDQGRLLLLA